MVKKTFLTDVGIAAFKYLFPLASMAMAILGPNSA